MVAMATYSSNRLVMGKDVFFYRNVYSVVLYVSYDFCLNW